MKISERLQQIENKYKNGNKPKIIQKALERNPDRFTPGFQETYTKPNPNYNTGYSGDSVISTKKQQSADYTDANYFLNTATDKTTSYIQSKREQLENSRNNTLYNKPLYTSNTVSDYKDAFKLGNANNTVLGGYDYKTDTQKAFERYGLNPETFGQSQLDDWAKSHGFGKIKGGISGTRGQYQTMWGKKYTDEVKNDLKIFEKFVADKETQRRAEEYPKAMTALTMAGAPARGIFGAASYLADATARATGGNIDSDSVFHQAAAHTSNVRSTVRNNIKSSVGQFLYDIGTSMGDNVATVVATTLLGAPTWVASGLMAGDSYSSNLINYKNKGYSDQKAAMLATANATVELLTEKYSLDEIIKQPKTLFKGLVRSGVAEGSEEVASGTINTAIDLIFNGEDADYRKRYNEYKNQGNSSKEALVKTFADFGTDTFLNFLGGAISGAGMHGAYTGASYTTAQGRYYNTVNSTNEKSVADKYKNASKEDISRLIEINEQLIDNNVSDKVKTQLYAEKNNLIGKIEKDDFTSGKSDYTNSYRLRTIGESFFDTQAEIIETGLNAPKDSDAYKNAVKLSTQKNISAEDIGRQMLLNINESSGADTKAPDISIKTDKGMIHTNTFEAAENPQEVAVGSDLIMIDGKEFIPRTKGVKQLEGFGENVNVFEDSSVTTENIISSDNNIDISGEYKVISDTYTDKNNVTHTEDVAVFEVDGKTYTAPKKYIEKYNVDGNIIKANKNARAPWIVINTDGEFVAAFMPYELKNNASEVDNSKNSDIIKEAENITGGITDERNTATDNRENFGRTEARANFTGADNGISSESGTAGEDFSEIGRTEENTEGSSSVVGRSGEPRGTRKSEQEGVNTEAETGKRDKNVSFGERISVEEQYQRPELGEQLIEYENDYFGTLRTKKKYFNEASKSLNKTAMVQSGKTKLTYNEIDKSEYTSEMLEITKKNNRFGIKTVFTVGETLAEHSNGKIQHLNGGYVDETIYINANLDFNLKDVATHELTHYLLRKNAGIKGFSFEDYVDEVKSKFYFVMNGDSLKNVYNKVILKVEKSYENPQDYTYDDEFLADMSYLIHYDKAKEWFFDYESALKIFEDLENEALNATSEGENAQLPEAATYNGYDFEVSEAVDTRDDKPIYLMKLKNKISQEEYTELNKSIRENGGYYSRFLKAFLFKNKADILNLIENNSDIIKEAESITGGMENERNTGAENSESDRTNSSEMELRSISKNGMEERLGLSSDSRGSGRSTRRNRENTEEANRPEQRAEELHGVYTSRRADRRTGDGRVEEGQVYRGNNRRTYGTKTESIGNNEIVYDEIAKENYTDELKSISDKNNVRGIRTVFTDNEIKIKHSSGKETRHVGFYLSENNTIYLNINSGNSPTDMNNHELTHAFIRKAAKVKEVPKEIIAGNIKSDIRKLMTVSKYAEKNNEIENIVEKHYKNPSDFQYDDEFCAVIGHQIYREEAKEWFFDYEGALKIFEDLENESISENTENEQNSDGEIKYSVAEKEEKGLKQTLKENIPFLEKHDILCSVDANTFNDKSRKISVQVEEYFSQLGNKVHRDNFGDVIIDKSGVKSSIAHGIGRSKSMAFVAVPEVIKNGVEIDFQKGWKGRNYDTYVFAAPINLNNNRAYLAVVVRKNLDNNKYYLHEVLNEQGDIIKINNGDDTFKTASIVQNDTSRRVSSPSTDSISQKSDVVNRYYMKNSEKYSASESELFAAHEEVTENLSKQIDNWLSGNMRSDEQFAIGNTPEVLKQIGADELPVVMSQSVMAKITGIKHSISLDEIRQLPNAIADPIMVFNSSTVPNAYVILTELIDNSGNDVVVAMHLNRKSGFNLINRISSVYEKNNVVSFIETQIGNGNLKYIEKNKSQEWLRSRGLRLPKLNTILNSDNSISQKSDVVNRYYMKNSVNNSENSQESEVIQNERGDILHDDSGERTDSQSSRVEAGEMEKRTGSDKTGREAAGERREYCEAQRASGNTERRVIFNRVRADIIKREGYNDEMLRIEAENAEKGLDTIFITGEGTLASSNGKRVYGGYDKKTQTVFIQYDNEKYSPKQLNRHEIIHHEYNSERTRRARNIILNNMSIVQKKTALRQLSEDYNNIISDNESAIYEEFICNVLAGMNDYSVTFNELVSDYWSDSEITDYYSPNTYAKSIDAGGEINITFEDVKSVQSIGRKSVNEFTSEEIEKTKNFAEKYFKEIGTKSPFFRAWFGDWRVNDITPVNIATEKGTARGKVKNNDTGWNIQISGKVFNETKGHKGPNNKNAIPYLDYINSIVENAVLLDSYSIGEKKSENSVMMHSLYAIADMGKGEELIKLYVEELNDVNNSGTIKRSYQLQNLSKIPSESKRFSNNNRLASSDQRYDNTISQTFDFVKGNNKKAPEASVRVQSNSPSSLTNTSSADTYTVSQLFQFVKTLDKNFNPKPSSKIINEDGTPKIVYHGTNADFTEFDKNKIGSNTNNIGIFGNGFYFTNDYRLASNYNRKDGDIAKDGTGNVMAAYLDIKEPFLYSGDGNVSIAPKLGFPLNRIKDGKLLPVINEKDILRFTKGLKSAGYDGVVYDYGDGVQELVIFSPNQIKSATDNIGTFDGNNADIRYSYAGVNSQTADIEALDKAKQMKKAGEPKEKIWNETGWGIGLDGEWRYEFPDNEALLIKNGIFQNPDITRFKELESKFIMGTITQAELEEIRNLSKALNSVRKNPVYLNEFLKHDELFNAYPQLKNVKVKFVDLPRIIKGEYLPSSNVITINQKLDNVAALSSMLHEVQHTIQHIEGFETGGNTDEALDFARQLAEDELVRRGDKEYLYLSNNPDKVTVFEINDYLDNFIKKEFGTDDIEEIAFKIYREFYGEKEARSVQERQTLTQEQRRERYSNYEKGAILKNGNRFTGEQKYQNSGLDVSKNETDDKKRKRTAVGATEHINEAHERRVQNGTGINGSGTAIYEGTKSKNSIGGIFNEQPESDAGGYSGEGFGNISEDEIKYSAKEKDSVFIPYSDYRQLREYIMSKNNNGEKLKSVDCKEIGDSFYIWRNDSKTDFRVTASIPIVGNEDKINIIRESIVNGTYRSSESFDSRAKRVRSGRRRNSRNNSDVGEIGKYRNNDRLSTGQPESDARGYSGEGFGNISEDEIKYSVAEASPRYNGQYDGWDLLKEKYGVIHPGERAVREAQVPKQISDTRYVSQYARTMMEARATPNDVLGQFERAVLDGTVAHEVITDKAAMEEAYKTIEKLGFDGAMEEWDKYVHTGAVGKMQIVLGQTLYNQCVNSGDYKNAMKIAAELILNETQAGQALQASRCLKLMGADGQLYYIEKSVQKMNKEFKERLGKKFKDIEIDEELMKKFLEAKGEENKNTAYDKLLNDIAKQIPSTLSDKWNSCRYLAMLGNTRTHMRNVIGNTAMWGAVKIKNYSAALMEKGFVKESERTKAFRKTRASKEFALQDFEKMKDVLQGNEGKYSTVNDIEERRRIFKNKLLEFLRKGNFKLLEAEDMLFLKAHYTDALARIITARKLDVDFLNSGSIEANEILDRIRAYAVKEAKEATFRDYNSAADLISKTERSMKRAINPETGKPIKGGKAAAMLTEGIMPFKTTPMNIVKQGVRYSPVSLFTATKKAFWDLRKGECTATEVVNTFAKGLTGSALMALGALLASLGFVRGAADDDDKKNAFDKLVGEQNYALKFGDDTYTIDWAAPACLPFFVGAELYEQIKNRKGVNLQTLAGSLARLTDPILELSVFSGVSNVLDAIKYDDSSALVSLPTEILSSYFGQALPTIGGQLSRIADSTKRDYYYIDKNSQIPEFVQSFINKAGSKIPFASFLFEPSIDNWGREESYGNVFERVLENAVSPGYYSKAEYTEVDKELKNIYDEIGDSSVFPTAPKKYIDEKGVKYNLSAKEYTELKKAVGQKRFEKVKKLINKSAYRYLEPEDKAKRIANIYSDAYTEVKKEMLKKLKEE